MLQKACVFAVALALSGGAHAASDADLAAIKAQIDEMKKSYEQRIAALEQKLAAAESRPQPTESSPLTSPVGGGRSGSSAFNPEVSLILDGKYASTSRDPETYRLRGFIPNGGEIAPPRHGLSIGETELALSANVDHLFRGTALFSVAGDGNGINTEEAFVETLSLPAGFKLKAGRFLSGVGYLNAQHPHSWDFVDAPLAYKAFYGSRLSNDGIQLKWLAPTPFFFEIGAEVARGDGFPGNERNKNGSGLGTAFIHIGDDAGYSNAWQAGLSYVQTHARDRAWDDQDQLGGLTRNAFTGRSSTLGADFVWKWAPDGNPTQQNFKFQSEYFQRRESGSLAYDDSNGSHLVGTASDSYQSRQTGWYAQGVWQFMPRWRIGLRHDRLDSGSVRVGLVDNGTISANDIPSLSSYAPQRNSLMLDWSPSEFSRLRLQFARDTSRGPGETDNQFFVQYIMSLGAHGAHKF